MAINRPERLAHLSLGGLLEYIYTPTLIVGRLLREARLLTRTPRIARSKLLRL
jgi:hypothetical protein